MSTLANIKVALAKRGFEVVDAQEQPRQLRLMGRVASDVNIGRNWLLVVHKMLSSSANEANAWKVDASKQYLLHGNRVLYAWRLIFQGERLAASYGDIVASITTAPKSNRVEVTEFALPGMRANRNMGGPGKGSAGPIGTIRVGAEAKR